MPGPQASEIALTEIEREELQQLVRRHSTGQQMALRARLILAAAANQSNSQIARDEGVHVDTVRLWRRRWLEMQPIPLDDLGVSERLEDAPRSGKPPTITSEQFCQIVALACEAPAQSDRPISQWSGREIADEIQKRGILKQISPRHASRLLKKGTFNPTASATG